MAKQSCILLISFYDNLYGAEKARINGIESHLSIERAVAAVHPVDAQVKWTTWSVPMVARNVSESAALHMDRDSVISLLLHQAFDETHGNESVEMIGKIQQEQLFASGIDAEIVEEVRKRLTTGRSTLFLTNPEDCTGVIQHLQKDAAFLLQKSFIWDEELMVALVGVNVEERFDEIHYTAISEVKAMQQAAPRSWLKKLMGAPPQF